MAFASVTLTGDKELDARFKQLEPKIAKRGVSVATRAAAKDVLEEAKRLVPVDSGDLEASLTVRVARRAARGRRLGRGVRGHTVTTREGLFQGEQFYGGFVEFGTEKWEGDAFLRPALFGREAQARAIFKKVLSQAVRNSAASIPTGPAQEFGVAVSPTGETAVL